LKISELEKDWTEYPVFHIEFNRSGFSSLESLKSVLRENLAIIEKVWGETDKNEELSVRFSTLIREAAEKSGKKVVVLVDEYDKPLFATMHDDVLNDQMRTELKGFYGVLKAEDEHLRFVFLTGVTKFSQVSVFSDLNHLDDISLFKEYAQICGISEAELLANFQPDIEKLATENEMSFEATVNKLRHYYDGYHFAKKSEGMYNPFSLLRTFQKRDFGFYWFETGTPTFLIEMVKNAKIDVPTLEKETRIAARSIMDYRFENKNPIPVLYQSGYLTIKGYDKIIDEYILGYPNEEVKYGFLNELMPMYYDNFSIATEFHTGRFVQDLYTGNIEKFMQRLQAFFANIPYDLENKTEKHYQTIFYLLFNLMGQFIKVEEHSAIGSSDAVVEVPDRIYIFEFKLDGNGTVDDAMKQIETKNYAGKYQLSDKEIIKIGAVFDNEKRGLKEWKYSPKQEV
jgi:hypothetical protein